MTKVQAAIVLSGVGITLKLEDKYGDVLDLFIPTPTRSLAAELEDRLLSAGVKVTHA